MSVQLECARVGLVGRPSPAGSWTSPPRPSAAAWLLEHSLHLEPGDATRTADLARACAQPANQVMAAAVSGGTVTVRKAVTALRQLRQVEHALAPGNREQALASLTQMAQTGYDRHVVAVGRHLMAVLGDEDALADNEKALSNLKCLRLCPLENGMTRISGQLDPEGAAILQAALDPLSAPNPCSENGGRDPRPPERRRADALVELCRRAAAAGGAAPATTKAQVVVTIDLERLTQRSAAPDRPWTARPSPPRPSARWPATPRSSPWSWAVKGQPLDVGRAKRLVTPGLLAALWARDKGCTYPGCGRPPLWCDAHHVKHWADGGPTSLMNLALLCGHHHTYVHHRDLTATVTATDVTWHT